MPFLTHNNLTVTRHQVTLERLPACFNGLRLVQISDLHFYEHTDDDYYERVLQAIQAEKPDIIVMTGDVIHYGPNFVQRAGQFLKRLDAPMAKLAILGNHDYNDGALGANVRHMLAESGFDLLVNEVRGFPDTNDSTHRLWVGGLDDLWYGRPDIDKTLGQIDPPPDGKPQDAVIMLIHNPLLFDPLAMAYPGKIDLVLSGHTHAGHVYIPFLGPIYQKIFRMKYRYGFFNRGGCKLYVTSGVGSAAFYLKKRKMGFPRFRFNTTPEIASLELRLAHSP